jgi:zinc protease
MNMSALLALIALALPAVAGAADEKPAPAPAEPPAETGASPTSTPVEPQGPDRSRPPPVQESPLLEHPAPEVHPIAPGVEAWHVQVPGVRKVAVHLVMGRGIYEWKGDPTFPNRAVGVLADMAAGDLSGAELSTERDMHEVDLWSALRLHDGELSLLVPKDWLSKGLELQKLVLTEPAFPKKDVKRWILDQQLYYTVEGPASQAVLANSTLAYAWFPPNSPYGVRPDLNELALVKSKDLQKRWADLLQNVPITAIVVGDLPWSEIEKPLTELLAGTGRGVPAGQTLEIKPPEKTQVLAVDMKGQEQVAIRLRMAAPPRNHEDSAEMMASNFVLGGYFLSRLNRNLREEKGFTYGAGSQYVFTETYGSVTVSVDVKPENLAETVTEIEGELKGLYAPAPAAEEGPDLLAEELLASRRTFASDWNRYFERADSAMGLYRSILRQKQTVAQARQVVLDVGAAAPADVRRVSEQWFGPEAPRTWIIVGDRASIEAELIDAGLVGAKWLTPTDAILGKF